MLSFKDHTNYPISIYIYSLLKTFSTINKIISNTPCKKRSTIPYKVKRLEI